VRKPSNSVFQNDGRGRRDERKRSRGGPGSVAGTTLRDFGLRPVIGRRGAPTLGPGTMGSKFVNYFPFFGNMP